MTPILLTMLALSAPDARHSTPDPMPLRRDVVQYVVPLQQPSIYEDDCPDGKCPLQRRVVPSGYHAHRAADGTVVIHGNENVGNAAAHAGIERPWVRIAEAGQTVTQTSVVTTQSSYSARAFRPFASLRERIRSRGLWFPGKNLLRGFGVRAFGGCP